MMVRLAPHDGKRPVELLYEYESYHLMRKSHLGQRQAAISHCQYPRMKTVRSTDYECYVFAGGYHFLDKNSANFTEVYSVPCSSSTIRYELGAM